MEGPYAGSIPRNQPLVDDRSRVRSERQLCHDETQADIE